VNTWTRRLLQGPRRGFPRQSNGEAACRRLPPVRMPRRPASSSLHAARQGYGAGPQPAFRPRPQRPFRQGAQSLAPRPVSMARTRPTSSSFTPWPEPG
jgi:hypothetical protein